MTRTALRHLYPDTVPVRGEIAVALREPLHEGVAGVQGSVISLIVGAGGTGGFKGLAGRFVRHGLLRYAVPQTGQVRFSRVDTGAWLELAWNQDVVPRPAGLKELMRKALMPECDQATHLAFAREWQEWVRRILLDHADDASLAQVVKLGGPHAGIVPA